MGDHTVAEQKATEQADQFVKLVKDLNRVTEESLKNLNALTPNLPPSKAEAIQSYLKGHLQKLEVLLNIYNTSDKLAALQRARKENDWLEAAAGLDIARLTIELTQSAAQANLKFAAVVAVKQT